MKSRSREFRQNTRSARRGRGRAGEDEPLLRDELRRQAFPGACELGGERLVIERLQAVERDDHGWPGGSAGRRRRACAHPVTVKDHHVVSAQVARRQTDGENERLQPRPRTERQIGRRQDLDGVTASGRGRRALHREEDGGLRISGAVNREQNPQLHALTRSAPCAALEISSRASRCWSSRFERAAASAPRVSASLDSRLRRQRISASASPSAVGDHRARGTR